MQLRRAACGAYAFDIEASFEFGILLSAIHAALQMSPLAESSSRFIVPSFEVIALRRVKLEVIGSSAVTQSRAYSYAARPMPRAMAATEGREESNVFMVPLKPEPLPSRAASSAST